MAPSRVHDFFRERLVRNYDGLMRPLERRALGEARRRLLASASGVVLDLGAGTGANFAHYGAAASRVVAVDPEPGMLERAAPRAAAAAAPVALVRAPAESLPFADGAFDTVVATLVLCTVADPARALAEVARVLAPAGRVLMLEHVRPPNAALGLLADLLTPAQRVLAAGCHLNRLTHAAVVRSGLRVESLRERLGGAVVEIEAVGPSAA